MDDNFDKPGQFLHQRSYNDDFNDNEHYYVSHPVHALARHAAHRSIGQDHVAVLLYHQPDERYKTGPQVLWTA